MLTCYHFLIKSKRKYWTGFDLMAAPDDTWTTHLDQPEPWSQRGWTRLWKRRPDWFSSPPSSALTPPTPPSTLTLRSQTLSFCCKSPCPTPPPPRQPADNINPQRTGTWWLAGRSSLSLWRALDSRADPLLASDGGEGSRPQQMLAEIWWMFASANRKQQLFISHMTDWQQSDQQ